MTDDISGARFGRLVTLSPATRHSGGRSRPYWRCRCDCGTEKEVDRYALLRGDAQSCGCMQREKARQKRTTHGRAKTRLHRIWCNIIDRCTNPTNRAFHNYGGRGVAICSEWRESFAAFSQYVGEPPSDSHSIDRWPNHDGNYEPGNVRWATAKEQGRNRRGLVEIDYLGRRMCLAEAAELSGIPYATLRARIIRHGWPVEQALTVPVVVGQKVQP